LKLVVKITATNSFMQERNSLYILAEDSSNVYGYTFEHLYRHRTLWYNLYWPILVSSLVVYWVIMCKIYLKPQYKPKQLKCFYNTFWSLISQLNFPLQCLHNKTINWDSQPRPSCHLLIVCYFLLMCWRNHYNNPLYERLSHTNMI